MGNFKRVHIALLSLFLFGFLAIGIISAAGATNAAAASTVTAEPGSDGDPVVSKSYVDAEVAKLAAKLDSLTAEVQGGGGVGSGGSAGMFEVLQLKAGQSLIAGASAEIIVRAGKATAIQGKNGDGLADLTSGTGKDILGNQEIPNNHLLLVSRDDGRGVKAASAEVYLLFKGTYEIKK